MSLWLAFLFTPRVSEKSVVEGWRGARELGGQWCPYPSLLLGLLGRGTPRARSPARSWVPWFLGELHMRWLGKRPS